MDLQAKNAAANSDHLIPRVPKFVNYLIIITFTSSGTVQEGSFDQLIDHTNPALGTFKQRYWFSTEYWNGTGSPVIVFNPGEESATPYVGYLETGTLTGQYIEAIRGAGIVIEHRYWGTSSPFTDLISANLKYHTVAQAVEDMTYFANNVKLSFDLSGNSNAAKAPWVLVGGSYSGALAAWTATTAPGTFWAYHASSAPVEAIEDYWGYFYPIQQGMPANCSKDISRVIDHIDIILTNGSISDKAALKHSFGLGNVEHDSEFASVLVYPLDKWQESIANFLPFCDYLEGASTSGGKLPGTDGVGLVAALANYASYVSSHYGGSSYNAYDKTNPVYTNTTLSPTGGPGRQWQWLLCNEALGYWQTGAPKGQSTMVSRFVTPDYYQQTCNFYFPDAQFGLTKDKYNAKFQGWDVANTKRLLFSNGEFDPWRSAGVSSAFRPGGPLNSTAEIPIFILPDGIHVQDLYFADATPAIIEVRKQELAQMVSWIQEYYSTTSTTSSSTISSTTQLSSLSRVPTSTASITSSNTTINSTSKPASSQFPTSIPSSTSLTAVRSSSSNPASSLAPSSAISTPASYTPTALSTQTRAVVIVTDVVIVYTTVDCESTTASAEPTKIARSYRA